VKKLLLLAVLALAGYAGYLHFVTGENPLQKLQSHLESDLPTHDAQGRELAPCQRCLASGRITCLAPRCKEGQVPCPGRCLKLTDPGWQRVEGQDPKKLFKIYRVNGRTWVVGQNQAGEVFEVTMGEFRKLGACKICHKSTKVPCKSCQGTGQVTCVVCGGQRTVVKEAPTKT
jgi:hypothetical protein